MDHKGQHSQVMPPERELALVLSSMAVGFTFKDQFCEMASSQDGLCFGN